MDVPAEQKDRKGIGRHFISDFEQRFNKAVSRIPDDLGLLALFGALYRESCFTFNFRMQSCYQGILRYLLMDVLIQNGKTLLVHCYVILRKNA